mmetsp:Transcript_26810/g.76940  ORF Transcript_26810/g.76940 Transcript_26810/m.76940 type:complete len:80 (-) Transcript_26810:361-600(-)
MGLFGYVSERAATFRLAPCRGLSSCLSRREVSRQTDRQTRAEGSHAMYCIYVFILCRVEPLWLAVWLVWEYVGDRVAFS